MALILQITLNTGEVGEYWRLSGIKSIDAETRVYLQLWKDATTRTTAGKRAMLTKEYAFDSADPAYAFTEALLAPEGVTTKRVAYDQLKLLAEFAGAVDG